MGTALNERVAQLSDVYAFLLEQLGVEYSLISRGPWSGGVTPTSAVVKAKLPREGMNAQLLVSKDAGFTSPLRFGPVLSQTNRYDIVEFGVQGLEPNTAYHYALEINGRLDRKKRGEFRTFPKAEESASFQIAFASCGRTGSTRDIYDRIREHRPLFYMNMGDLHYEDIRSNSVALFRGAYDKVLASPQQSELYRTVPIVYMWDDHDYGGNNANRKSTTHPAARRAYNEYVPHYPFADPDKDAPIYHSFVVGRVKFIITDLRSERDDPKEKDDAKKTILGEKQKKWLKQELLASNGKYPLICWMSSVPFIGEVGKSPYRFVRTNEWGFIHHTNLFGRTNRSGTVYAAEEAEKAATNALENAEGDAANGAEKEAVPQVASSTNQTAAASGTNATARAGQGRQGRGQRGGNNNAQGGGGDEDHWSAFSFERREIADFIKSNNISGVCILHGDSHMMAADNGTHADYATGGGAPIPVMGAGPLDQNPSLKGGPYSQGVYRVRDKEGESGFGLLTITDKGSSIDVNYSGRNNKDEETITLRFSVPAHPPGMTARAK
jgi:phosphodiesterase/alkaline phosphatase D-like protein